MNLKILMMVKFPDNHIRSVTSKSLCEDIETVRSEAVSKLSCSDVDGKNLISRSDKRPEQY